MPLPHQTHLILAVVLLLCGGVGCQALRAPDLVAPEVPAQFAAGLSTPVQVNRLGAIAVPPEGWQANPLEEINGSLHQVWISPTGKTAFGVIHFTMPLAVNAEWALRGFLREMRRNEGQAELIERTYDRSLPGLRFIADGSRYTLRGHLMVFGRRGWTVYAGTLRDESIEVDELELAERARDHTEVGIPAEWAD